MTSDCRAGNGPYGCGFTSPGLLQCQLVEVLYDVMDVQHVSLFVMQIEQIDLVRKDAAVEAAFLGHHDVKAI